MTYGLLAALGWGFSGLAAAFAARRLGTFLTVFTGEAAGLAGFGVLMLASHASLRGAGSAFWPLLAAGLAGLAGYLTFYRGLEVGHAGLVSAVAATYGGVTVVLSVVLLRERLGLLAVLGIAAAVTGVMLAAWRGSPGAAATGAKPAAGIALGLASALRYGAGSFLLGACAHHLGWLTPVIIARAASMAVLLVLLATPLRRPPGGRILPGLGWAVVAGLTDAAALVCFTRGGQTGLVAVTAAASSIYPVIPLLGGVVLLRERLARWRVGGAFLTIAGVVLLAASS